MKNLIRATILLSVAAGAAHAADSASRDNPSPPAPPAYKTAQLPDYARDDPAFVAFDIILMRPLGLVATAIGSALFVATSPLTGLASIPEPHDAFESAYKVMVLTPARYTFERPVGDRTLMEGYDTQFGKMPAARQSTRY